MCKCNEEGILLTVVKDGPNKGRKFWKCRKGEHAACKFFEWDDEPPPPAQTGFGGTAAKGLSSRTPSLNTGVGAGGKSDTCYKVASLFASFYLRLISCCFLQCGQEGHWSKGSLINL